MSKELSQHIKSLRENRGLTQEELASKLNISRSTYINIEKGSRSLKLSESKRIAEIFGITLEDLNINPIADYEKYKEMIIAFLRVFALIDNGKIPKTKLAKLLYLADFAWFYENIESMSGMQYRRIKYGPVPDMYFRALDELEEDGAINRDNKSSELILISENARSKKEELKRIKKEELDLIKKIANKWKAKKTREIVSFTHKQLPYKLSSPEEIIPYELIIQEDPEYVY